MWKKSKVTDQTAAGQAGKCRVMVWLGHLRVGIAAVFTCIASYLRNNDEQDLFDLHN